MAIRDTFELNPGLAELFKRKILDIAKDVQFPADLIDFELHMDMKGTYSENLRAFYREYPRLSERSDFFNKNPIRPISEGQIERNYRAYQVSNGEIPEPIIPVIAIANSGETLTERTNPEPTAPSFPTLSFSFNYSTNGFTEAREEPRTELKSTVQEHKSEEPTLGLEDRLREVVLVSTHVLIVGKKDQGKSALGYHLLDLHKDSRPCYVYRPPRPDLLPSWIKPISDMEELPNNAVCMIDESPTEFDQYSYRKLPSKYVAELMRIARHKNQSIIVIAQNSTDLNRNFIFPIDVYLLKQPSMFQRLEERRIIRSAYERIAGKIAVNEYYWYDQELFTKGTFEKPEYYTQELSKAYANYSQNENPSQEAESPQTITELKEIRQPTRARTDKVLPELNAPRFSSEQKGIVGLAAFLAVVGLGMITRGLTGFLVGSLCLALAAIGTTVTLRKEPS